MLLGVQSVLPLGFQLLAVYVVKLFKSNDVVFESRNMDIWLVLGTTANR